MVLEVLVLCLERDRIEPKDPRSLSDAALFPCCRNSLFRGQSAQSQILFIVCLGDGSNSSSPRKSGIDVAEP